MSFVHQPRTVTVFYTVHDKVLGDETPVRFRSVKSLPDDTIEIKYTSAAPDLETLLGF